jgi:hypothetical protein
MTEQNGAMDVRTNEQKREMAEHFETFEADYRDEDYNRSEVVYEDGDIVVVADHAGYELNEWADHFGIEARDFRHSMHELARRLCDYSWSVSDPVVFDKPEGSE